MILTRFPSFSFTSDLLRVLASTLATLAMCALVADSHLHAATIIDFDGEENGTGSFSTVASPYEEDGVTLTTVTPATSFPVLSTSHLKSIGSPYLFPFDATEFLLSATDAELGIALNSITIVEAFNPTPTDIIFYGTRLDGSIISETISTEGDDDVLGDGGAPESYNFSALAREPFALISFAASGLEYGVDNISVQLLSPIPEPASGVLFFGIAITAVFYCLAKDAA